MTEEQKTLLQISSNDTIIASSDTMYNLLKTTQGNFRCVGALTTDDFIHLWTLCMSTNHDNIIRVYNTLTATYNPIHNYDKTETVSETTNNTKSGSVTNNITTDSVDTNGNTTIDNSAMYNTSQSNNNTTTDSTTTYNNYSDNTTKTYTNNTSGNIGVTKTQDMILSEISLRSQYNIATYCISLFRDMYLI